MSIKNSPLLRKVADAIEAAPESYDQTVWATGSYSAAAEDGICNTRACIAGEALLLSGVCTLTVVESASGWMPYVDIVHTANGSPVHDYSGEAAKVLGFTPGEAAWLFHSDWVPPRWNYRWSQAATARAVARSLRAIADGASVYSQGRAA